MMTTKMKLTIKPRFQALNEFIIAYFSLFYSCSFITPNYYLILLNIVLHNFHGSITNTSLFYGLLNVVAES